MRCTVKTNGNNGRRVGILRRNHANVMEARGRETTFDCDGKLSARCVWPHSPALDLRGSPISSELLSVMGGIGGESGFRFSIAGMFRIWG